MNHNCGAYVRDMNEEEYQIISNLIKDGGRFSMSPQKRIKAQKNCLCKVVEIKKEAVNR